VGFIVLAPVDMDLCPRSASAPIVVIFLMNMAVLR